jgi:hypothetical protein
LTASINSIRGFVQRRDEVKTVWISEWSFRENYLERD